MKTNYLYTILLFFILSSCKKENEVLFIPKNYLAEFKSDQSQFFELNNLDYKEINGKHGTKIMYSRDLFDLKETDKVKLELIELYDYNEILYRNIQTLTTDNQLLETSGVLKIVFTSNGKKLKFKKGSKIIVYPPKGKLKNNDIFLSETDSIGSIKWKITNQDYTEITIYKGGGIYIKDIIRLDSLNYYLRKLGNAFLDYKNYSSNDDNELKNYFVLEDNSWNWINIDKFSNLEKVINFQLKDSQQKFPGFQTFITYNNKDSFLSESRYKNYLEFDSIPIDNPTHLIVIGEYKKHVYFDKIKLDEGLNNSEIKLDMKKTTKEELKNLFKQ